MPTSLGPYPPMSPKLDLILRRLVWLGAPKETRLHLFVIAQLEVQDLLGHSVGNVVVLDFPSTEPRYLSSLFFYLDTLSLWTSTVLVPNMKY